AVRRVAHLGMELNAVERPLAILHGGDGDLLSVSRHAEAIGRLGDRVAMAHPNGVVGREVRKDLAGGIDVQSRSSVLALAGRLDPAAQRLSHQLVPVADPQDRNPHAEERGIYLWPVGFVNGGGTAGEDQTGWSLGGDRT